MPSTSPPRPRPDRPPTNLARRLPRRVQRDPFPARTVKIPSDPWTIPTPQTTERSTLVALRKGTYRVNPDRFPNHRGAVRIGPDARHLVSRSIGLSISPQDHRQDERTEGVPHQRATIGTRERKDIQMAHPGSEENGSKRRPDMA